ncbi:uncharacterized protein LOC128887830 isoform X1 [Hylaeus anthracinus]|uniref:uncharacterized protein LOC128887830 isoform X1 n=1 Tax=Hylaeus anthracinus TaxID=313031 RepID=UPI0023B9B311|nr:uncharacterized protein LOC128887830 isoform X1 [Hylaeus anthracinus]
MSADSPRRGVHKGAQVVSPQPIVDRTIIDSVAGIINDIVPQAYTGTPNSDNTESISWARFEYADINDPALYPDYNEGSNTPPLLLVLGYATGVQVWLIAATGEATEVLSWRQGVVRTLRILPNPKTDDEHVDLFDLKRPMVAVCDSAGPGPQFCNISFISLKTGEQAKSIKFKNPVCDILANKRSIVVTFLEKIAVFDARTLEDVLTVTTCYASPGPNPNPVALGMRWLAYSEKKLLPAKRSSGGCEGEGVQSYTAAVLYAAKSLGKGLRGLGETVASSLTGNSVSPVVINNTGSDVTQPGVITILDLQAAKEEKELDDANIETVIAHFTAHSDAIVAMTFDLSGALLLTADKRGHDFHVFRIQPHPGGPALAAVHHLYILHRGDTTAKVQDMVFSSDTRWAAISTVRGTTHVFPVAPYGGPVGVRTHSTPHVVNRLSRFHRSAGLMDDGTRSHSPVSHTELPLSIYPYSNPRLPPYPHPTVLHPLAQIRQPSSLNHVNNQAQQSRPQQRQRLHSDDSGILSLKICACFAPPRAWMYAQRESTAKVMKRAVDSLFIMACHGNMIQYDLEPKPAAGIPKEKVCDDTTIELEVEAKGQWPLLRCPNSLEILPPLSTSSPLLSVVTVPKDSQDVDVAEDRWLSQVEIVTHAGPHRRLWMGPQFVFKTYNATSGAPVNLVEAEAVEIGVTGVSRPARSNPVNMPRAASRSLVPVVIDGSGNNVLILSTYFPGSYEQSPRFMEAYGDSLDSENTGVGNGENQLREDLAEAMLETSIAPHRAPGRRSVFERVGQPVTKVVNPLGTVITVSADEEDANSSLEFDSAEECHVPEPPRSVCAEEGPASLGDFEPESQTLRDLTEICAEMRSASEPAIDSVPDEDICEVKEKKLLCVEIAPLANPGSCSIDFEKEEAFRDMPTSLSLCVEQGEIPSSPMTQAKETTWVKRFDRKEEKSTHERTVPEAQYVVNCSDDSVVLVENKSAQGRRNAPAHCKKAPELERPKKLGRNAPAASSGKREFKAPMKKYILKEHEDSIVVEDTREEFKNSCKRKVCEKTILEESKSKSSESKVESSKETGKSKSKSKSSATQDSKEAKVTVEKESKYSGNIPEPIVELGYVAEDTDKAEESKSEDVDKYKSPPSESTDDFSSSEYHIVETPCCSKEGTLVQSDEDIEHIQRSEITQLQQAECIDGEKCAESPVMQRKNSKNTISDDDLEYIHSSELVETPDKKSKEDLQLEAKKSDYDSSASKRTLSDDDIEHVQHSDVCPVASEVVKDDCEKVMKKSQETPVEQKPKSVKKTKDIVVIESDSSAADVTVIIKESWRSKSVEKKEDLEECTKDTGIGESLSPLKKIKSRQAKTSPSNVPPKRSQAGIEIIDIDAMQKAEMEVLTDAVSAPECKILSGPEVSVTRPKKSRKNKKSNTESNPQFEVSTEPRAVEETAKESSSQKPAEFSWSAIVKKKSISVEREIPKEDDKLVEVEDTPESVETAKWNPAKKPDLGKKKLQETSSKKSSEVKSSQVVDKLREAVTELDSGEPVVEPVEISWSSIVRKNSMEEKKDGVEANPEEQSVEGKKTRRKHESSFRSSAMIDKLREAVTELDSGEPPAPTADISWSSIVRKKNPVDQETKKEPDFEPITEELDTLPEVKNTENLETSSFRSTMIDEMVDQSELPAKETFIEPILTEPPISTVTVSEETLVPGETEVEVERSSWSSIVKKRAASLEPEVQKESQAEASEKVDVSESEMRSFGSKLLDSLEGKPSGSRLFNIFVTQVKRFEKPSKLEGSSDEREYDFDGSSKVEPLPVDLAFLKEDSSEPERDPEKRSDSEQEVVPERSSSSDELNANVVFANAEGDYTGREVVERSPANGATTSVCSTFKKSNKWSKKKKRR